MDDGQPDRVWTAWGSRCEYPVRTIVSGRNTGEFVGASTIKDPEDVEVREPFDIDEPRFELRQELKDAFGVVFGSRPARDLGDIAVAAADETDGAE